MPLQFALIGCGRIGQRHAGYIEECGKLAAVCDIDRERAIQTGKKYKATVYFSIDELLVSEKNIDVAVICTPNGLHAAQSISAMKAGCHVLCEKPMALTSADCTEMIKTAEKKRKHLLIVKQNRYNPPVEAVKKLLDEHILGKISGFQLSCFWHRDHAYYRGDWRGTKSLDGGTLFTQFSHFIDLICWFFGKAKKTEAFLGNYFHRGVIEFEDTGTVIMQFENDIIGTMNYTVNSYKKNMEGSLTIFGENGTVKIGGQYLNELEYLQTEKEIFLDMPSGSRANDYGSYQGSMSNHDKVYQNLVEVLNHHGKIKASSYDGLRTVELIEQIYASGKHIY